MTHALPEVVVTERLTLAHRDDSEQTVAFDIRKTTDDDPVGKGSLCPLEAGDWRVELSIHDALQGRGYGREAARALLGLAFSELRATCVIVDIPLENERATRIAERMGMNGQGGKEGARRYMLWRAPGSTPPRRQRR